jgi:hypothetical protein
VKAAADDADKKSRIYDSRRRIYRIEEGLPVSRKFDTLGILLARYHCGEDKKWDEPGVHDGSKDHVAS